MTFIKLRSLGALAILLAGGHAFASLNRDTFETYPEPLPEITPLPGDETGAPDTALLPYRASTRMLWVMTFGWKSHDRVYESDYTTALNEVRRCMKARVDQAREDSVDGLSWSRMLAVHERVLAGHQRAIALQQAAKGLPSVARKLNF
jgi:hypothetical protein